MAGVMAGAWLRAGGVLRLGHRMIFMDGTISIGTVFDDYANHIYI
jgi:hypothetical protein